MNDKERLLQSIFEKKGTITAIIGLSKNAGKSTLLNWLMQKSPINNLGVLTTGRDGEDFDTVAKLQAAQHPKMSSSHSNKDNKKPHPKPKISVPPKTLFVTTTKVVREHSPYLSIIEKSRFKAAGESLWLVRTETLLNTEIVGPPTVKEQIEIANEMLKLGAEHVFIDGSFDRKAISLAVDVKNIVLVAGAGVGELEEVKKRIRYLDLLTRIEEVSEGKRLQIKESQEVKEQIAFFSKKAAKPYVLDQFDRLIGNEKMLKLYLEKEEIEALYLPTSLTYRAFSIIKGAFFNRNIKLIVKHPLNISIDNESLERFLPQLYTMRKMAINAVAVNSYDPYGKHLDCDILRAAIRKDFDYPVVDVTEAI